MVKKNTIMDYLLWRSDLTFEQDGFNEIDGYIFAQLTFINISPYLSNESRPLKDLLKSYFDEHKKEDVKLGAIIPYTVVDMAYEVMKSKRYASILVSDYVYTLNEDETEQFCACTYHFGNNCYIAYQGTDDTLTGWEENLRMIITYPVNAQVSAKSYFDKIFSLYPNDSFVLLGHSKGGNLAMYAGLYATEEQNKKIVKIINYDGPGFEDDDLDLERYEKIKNKIRTYLPTRSSVAMIFNQLGKLKCVKCDASHLDQHDGFRWYVEGTKFVRSNLSSDSIKMSKELNSFISKLDEKQRMHFCNSLRDFIKMTGCKTLTDIKNNKSATFKALKAFKHQDRSITFEFLRILLKYHFI